jgi:hypothetical protein
VFSLPFPISLVETGILPKPGLLGTFENLTDIWRTS